MKHYMKIKKNDKEYNGIIFGKHHSIWNSVVISYSEFEECKLKNPNVWRYNQTYKTIARRLKYELV